MGAPTASTPLHTVQHGPANLYGPPSGMPMPMAPHTHLPHISRPPKPINAGHKLSWFNDDPMDTSEGVPFIPPAMAPPKPGRSTPISRANGHNPRNEQGGQSTSNAQPRLTSSPLWEALLK
ncbi:hypothetical protein CPB86DRAFT_830838, partial [Serendipita vermifera]